MASAPTTDPAGGQSNGIVERQLRDMNEALLVSSVRQHALAEQARNSEAAMRESEEGFRSLFEQSVAGIAECDLQGRLRRVNPRFCEIVGRNEVELCGGRGLRMEDLTHPDDWSRDLPLLQRTATLGTPFITETRFVLPNGSEIWASCSASLVRHVHGEPQSIVAVCVDVTSQKWAAEALRESEERYHTLFDLGPVAVYSIDVSGVIQTFNRRAAELWGREPARGDTDERFCGSLKLFRPDGSYMPHEECPMALVVAGTISEARDAEVIIERPDGSRVTVIVNIRPLKNKRGETTGAINAFYDITDRKLAEDALRRSEEGLERELAATQQLQAISSLLIQGGDTHALYQRIVEAAVAIMHSDFASMQMLHPERGSGGELNLLAFIGFTPEAAASWTWIGADSETSCGRALRRRERVIVLDVEHCQWLAGSENLRTYLEAGIRAMQSTPLFSRGGRLLGMISTHWRRPHTPQDEELRRFDILARLAADLIERKAGEEATARLASIVKSSDDAIISKDLDGIITTWNEGAQHLFGYPAEEAIGQPVSLLIPEDHLEEEPQILERIRSGQSVEHFETVRRRKDGTRVDISLTISPLRDAAGTIIGASKVARDITDRKRAADVLRESEDRFRTLADCAPALVWVNGLEGCGYVNRGYLEFLGVTAAEVRGYDWAKFIHPDDRDNYVSAYCRAAEERAPFEAEFRFRRHDGEYRWMGSVGQPRFGPQHEFLGYAGVTFDITDRRLAEVALRASEERLGRNAETFSNLIEQAPFGIYVVDAGFRIQTVSVGALPAFRNVRPLIGSDFSEAMRILWPEPFASQVIEFFRHTLQTGEPYVAPSLTEHRRDVQAVESYEWQIHRVTLPDGQYGVVCYFFDATRLREAENALREADRRKDEFLAMLAHELRNPLAALSNAIHLSRVHDLGDNDQIWVQEMLERQLEQLGRLVDDLLDVSRFTRGQINLKREILPLATVVDRAVESLRPRFTLANHQLTVESSPETLWVEADRARLEQVLVNLLSNAIKYTPDGGHVWLQTLFQGGEAVISVRDTGIGITGEMLPKVFDLFAQAEQGLARSQGGLGIGLTLVRRLVELHGGSISVNSPGPGQGCKFTVRLPLVQPLNSECAPPPAKSAAPAPLGARSEGQPLRVLVVDDNRDAAQSLVRLLTILGHQPQIALNGPEALAAAANVQPQLALLDIGLPGMDGFELATRLKQAYPGIHLAAISGYGQASDRERAKAAGFGEHFVKPVNLESLLHLIEERQV